jgi:hypothetical protein
MIRVINEDGDTKAIDVRNLLDGNNKFESKAMKFERSRTSLGDITARLEAEMLRRYPDRGGYPKVDPSFTEDEWEKEQLRARSTKSNPKIRVINEDGDIKDIRLNNLLSGTNKFESKAMKCARIAQKQMISPKGVPTYYLQQVKWTDEFARLAEISIGHLEESQKASWYIKNSIGDGPSAYGQLATSALVAGEWGRYVTFCRTIAQVDSYLELGALVVLLVHDQHKILGCYIIGGKNDLAEWQKLTVGINKGTKLAASPFSTRTRKTATSITVRTYTYHRSV